MHAIRKQMNVIDNYFLRGRFCDRYIHMNSDLIDLYTSLIIKFIKCKPMIIYYCMVDLTKSMFCRLNKDC
jgi:hypothetical protein